MMAVLHLQAGCHPPLRRRRSRRSRSGGNNGTSSHSGNIKSACSLNVTMSTSDFYLRYYVGHKGKFGHEFLEFEFRPDGKLYPAAPIA